MIRNKRMEIVVIFAMIVLCFFSLYSINEKLSQKFILKNACKYLHVSSNTNIYIERKITYNNKLYIFYTYPEDTSNNTVIGHMEFEKNFLGWLCFKMSSSTKNNFSIQPIKSVTGKEACLIYGVNPDFKSKTLELNTKNKNMIKDISKEEYYLYLEEIYRNDIDNFILK